MHCKKNFNFRNSGKKGIAEKKIVFLIFKTYPNFHLTYIIFLTIFLVLISETKLHVK